MLRDKCIIYCEAPPTMGGSSGGSKGAAGGSSGGGGATTVSAGTFKNIEVTDT